MGRRVHYNTGDEIIELTIRDQTGSKIEVYRCNGKDAEELGRILYRIFKKFDIKPKLPNNFLDITNEFFKF